MNSNKSSAYIIRCESLENERLRTLFTYKQEQEWPQDGSLGHPRGNRMNRFHSIPLVGNGLTDNWTTNETELVECYPWIPIPALEELSSYRRNKKSLHEDWKWSRNERD